MKYVFLMGGRFFVCREALILGDDTYYTCTGLKLSITKNEHLTLFKSKHWPIYISSILGVFSCPEDALAFLLNMDPETSTFFNSKEIIRALI